MDVLSYQHKAMEFARPGCLPENDFRANVMTIMGNKLVLLEALVGMSSESGECLDILKKHLFQGHVLDKKELELELGDVLWYLTLACQALHCSLSEIMDKNIAKLQERYGDHFDPDRSVYRKSPDDIRVAKIEPSSFCSARVHDPFDDEEREAPRTLDPKTGMWCE